MEKVKLSIIVPCYNEAGNLPLIIKRFVEIFDQEPDIELILVDNGSTDDSQAVFSQEIKQANRPWIRTVLVPVNQGYGYGILSGLQASKGDVLAWTHADMQCDPSDVLKAYQYYLRCLSQGKNLMIKGFRINRSIGAKVFSGGMGLFASIMLRHRFSEVNAQPKIFPRVLLEYAKNAPNDFSLDLYYLYIAKQYKFEIKTIDVRFDQRKFGEAKGGAGDIKTRIKLIVRTIKFILEASFKWGKKQI